MLDPIDISTGLLSVGAFEYTCICMWSGLRSIRIAQVNSKKKFVAIFLNLKYIVKFYVNVS